MARPKTYTVNDNYFNKIDREDKAYWLGFLYADGYITKGGFGISLMSTDKEHLQLMLDDMDSNYKIKTYINSNKNKYGATCYCRVLINSQEMRRHIISYGIVEHKSLILEPPKVKFGTKELERHFLRGFFDGNGSVSGLKRKTYALKIVSTNSFLNWFAGKINYKYKKLHKRRSSDIVSSLEIAGINMVKKYGGYLYNNSTRYLKRKYNKLQYINDSE